MIDKSIPIELPQVNSLEDARFWLGVHQRNLIADAERMNRIEQMIWELKLPWYKRWLRK